MNGLDIHPLGVDQLDLLLQWRMRVLHEVFADATSVDWHALEQANRRYYLEAIAAGSHVAAMACADGEPIGCGAICLQQEMPSPDNPSGRCAYLMNIYVLPQWRGHGAGHEIVEWLIDCARKHGAQKIYLESSQCARHMYADLGFKPMPDMYHL